MDSPQLEPVMHGGCGPFIKVIRQAVWSSAPIWGFSQWTVWEGEALLKPRHHFAVFFHSECLTLFLPLSLMQLSGILAMLYASFWFCTLYFSGQELELLRHVPEAKSSAAELNNAA